MNTIDADSIKQRLLEAEYVEFFSANGTSGEFEGYRVTNVSDLKDAIVIMVDMADGVVDAASDARVLAVLKREMFVDEETLRQTGDEVFYSEDMDFVDEAVAAAQAVSG